MKKITFLIIFSQLVLFASELIEPIPESLHVNTKKAALGKKLFFDTILSKDKTENCASCHDLKNGGDDGLKFSFGINGQEGSVNAPTLYNAVFNFRQFWDGRAKDLQTQAEGPIENPVEMAHSFKKLVPILKKTSYKAKFNAIYKNGITKENITNAIAEYEKTLITPNAPFDLYLKGQKDAISEEQKEGYELFKAKGCITCHHGVNIGGNMYSKFGVFQDAKSNNLGRYNVTHKERDKYYFKVPSLRNITKTAPYFHDGRTYDLREAVLDMAKYQLGRKITNKEIDKIITFLTSLNGEIPKNIEPE